MIDSLLKALNIGKFKKPDISFKKGYFLVDSGIETTMIYHRLIELPHFASIVLLESEKGREELSDYLIAHLNTAKKYNMNFILETPTWRGSPDWGERLDYSIEKLCDLNAQAVRFMKDLRKDYLASNEFGKIYIAGAIGPRGDGYAVHKVMTQVQAKEYHMPQIKVFATEKVDMLAAYTLNYSDEAIGIARAAKEVGLPVTISFTVETDGRLPSGEHLKSAIEKVDKETNSYPLHYLVNCAHPTHITKALSEDGKWKKRIRGIRANASTKSHAELENSKALDMGDYSFLARGYEKIRSMLPNFNVIGGCCGTDHSHIEVICKQLFKK